MLAMGLIATGAALYVTVDRRSTTPTPNEAYRWILLWFTLLIFQLTYEAVLSRPAPPHTARPRFLLFSLFSFSLSFRARVSH